MKILQVINSLGTGGAEKLLLDSIPLYYEKGTSVDLLVLDGTEYPFLKQLHENNCCDIFSLGTGSVYNPLHIFKIIPYLKKYDVIHVHLFPALYWVALAKIITFSDVKLVYTEHCTTNRRMENFFMKIMDSLMYSVYNKIVCISKEVLHEIKRHVNLHISTFEIINNGVDLTKITNETPYTKAELGLKENARILIQVSRFQAQKDQPTLIRAMQYLPEQVILLLTGEGELIGENKLLAKQLGLEHRIQFLGIRMDVPKLLKSSDIVVLSSNYEGLSLSSIEGLASGKPFVASNVPGLTDLVFGAGVLVPQHDDKALGAQLNKLLDDQDHYDMVVKKCLIRAKQYGIDIMVDKHLDLYQTFI